MGHRGHLKGKKAIAFPGFEDHLTGAEVVCKPVVRDGNIITGRGMGCAIEFGLTIVEYFLGTQEKEALAKKIIYSE